MTAPKTPINPWLITLITVAVLSAVLAIVLGGVASAEAGTFSPDTAAVVAFATWSNNLLLISAVALVGVFVLEGAVRWTIRKI